MQGLCSCEDAIELHLGGDDDDCDDEEQPECHTSGDPGTAMSVSPR